MAVSFLSWIGLESSAESQRRHHEIIMKLNELKDALTGIDGKLTEASTEITILIADLRAALGEVDIPADVADALDAITAKAKSLADIVS